MGLCYSYAHQFSFQVKNHKINLGLQEMAVQMEVGLPSNPLRFEWVNPPQSRMNAPSSLVKPSDFESIVLTKMRQAEERRRLIEQLKAEDGDD